jgi:hypothetical protein
VTKSSITEHVYRKSDPPNQTWSQYLGDEITDEFIEFMLGKCLGRGVYRDVYEMPSDPKNWVYKVERFNDGRYFNNVVEWRLWEEIAGHDAAAWLAPCRTISRNGNILVQARTKPLKKLPDLVPDFLRDTHLGNFGLYKGRVVCHDYSFNQIPRLGLKKIKLVKPE